MTADVSVELDRCQRDRQAKIRLVLSRNGTHTESEEAQLWLAVLAQAIMDGDIGWLQSEYALRLMSLFDLRPALLLHVYRRYHAFFR